MSTRVVFCTMVLGLSGAEVGWAQDYPNKAIHVFTAEAGGGSDLVSRLIAQGLSLNLGQQVVVDNRPTGAIPVEIVARAPADGYTLLLFGPPFWIGPFLQKVSYDPMRDFAAVTLAGTSPNVLVVNASSAVKSIKDLITAAKAKPGHINFAIGSVGGASHLSAELFKTMAGVDIVAIPYKGNGPAVVALLGNQVDLLFATAPSVATQVKSGQLRALAVTSAQPSALFAGIPTLASFGLPGYESVTMQGMFAPASTPAAIINKLNQETLRVLGRPETKEKFLNAGLEATGSSPTDLANAIKADMARWGKVIKDAGIREQ